MKNRSLILVVVILGICVFGCGDKTAEKTTPEQEKAFKGGPMPADYAAKDAERAAKAMQEATSKAGAPR